jgi:hypothetical protein
MALVSSFFFTNPNYPWRDTPLRHKYRLPHYLYKLLSETPASVLVVKLFVCQDLKKAHVVRCSKRMLCQLINLALTALPFLFPEFELEDLAGSRFG